MKYKYLYDYETEWEDCAVSFVCPSCNDTILLDSQDEPRRCDCGRIYQLSFSIKQIVREEDE
jgi:hypothetical protein